MSDEQAVAITFHLFSILLAYCLGQAVLEKCWPFAVFFAVVIVAMTTLVFMAVARLM